MTNDPYESFSDVIGPQLGADFTNCGIKITIGLPDRPEIDELRCVVKGDNYEQEQTQHPEHDVFRDFTFRFDGLQSGVRYSYFFIDSQGNEVDLGGGLQKEDCYFNAPSFDGDSSKIITLSCNNPFESKEKGRKKFAMWDKVLAYIDESDDVRLLVQAGDQVYNDNIEKSCLKALKKDPENKEFVYRKLIENYQKFYGDISIRKILARTPSVAMLDDHDITDGWGGRPESYDKTKKNEFSTHWKSFFDAAYEAFKAYQSAKNPDMKLCDTAETTFIDFGDNRLYLLDLRAEKNIRNDERPLVSRQHEASILRSIDEAPNELRNIFILSPVVPVRISPEKEEKLKKLTVKLYELQCKAKTKSGLGWAILRLILDKTHVANMSDDIMDSLSYSKNRPFLKNLLVTLANKSRVSGQRVALISGDIHTAGQSELFVHSNNGATVIPQIVSSPIGYKPMSERVEQETTEKDDFTVVQTDGGYDLVTARNIYYRSDRNFAVIKPHDLTSGDAVEYIFENRSFPISFPAFFAKPDRIAQGDRLFGEEPEGEDVSEESDGTSA